MIGLETVGHKTWSLEIVIINGGNERKLNFYLDTGFSGFLKIDKKVFDELGIKKIRQDNFSVANGYSDIADIGFVNFKTDQANGSCEIVGSGWGGRNLVGVRFFELGKLILAFDFDGTGGAIISNDRALAFKIGKTISDHFNKTSES